jgi:hypothetical protein
MGQRIRIQAAKTVPKERKKLGNFMSEEFSVRLEASTEV